MDSAFEGMGLSTEAPAEWDRTLYISYAGRAMDEVHDIVVNGRSILIPREEGSVNEFTLRVAPNEFPGVRISTGSVLGCCFPVQQDSPNTDEHDDETSLHCDGEDADVLF